MAAPAPPLAVPHGTFVSRFQDDPLDQTDGQPRIFDDMFSPAVGNRTPQALRTAIGGQDDATNNMAVGIFCTNPLDPLGPSVLQVIHGIKNEQTASCGSL
jgi:hypothetical protein